MVVADSAFPVYAAPGIEIIVVNEDLPSVLKYVGAISSSRHVRATVFLDQELQFVDEHHYPGVSELRRQITTGFQKGQISSLPHAEAMAAIDQAGKTFRILFIKTTATIPYTAVYKRLDCGYMNDEVERKSEPRRRPQGSELKAKSCIPARMEALAEGEIRLDEESWGSRSLGFVAFAGY